MAYTIKYNRSSFHIDGIAVRTQSGGQDNGSGAVPYFAESVCGSLTRYRMATATWVAPSEDLREALRLANVMAANNNAKMCKNCTNAAQEILDQQDREADNALDAALSKLTGEELEMIRSAIADKRI